MSFKNLKKSRTAQLENLVKAAEAASATKNYSDDRFWSLKRDNNDNGYAHIRFLPAKDDESPWVTYYDHGFKGPTGRWYIEKSLTTIGENDPVSTYNSALWNSGIEADKDKARTQKRRLHYVSNIYVIDDKKHPENTGRVMLFRYGKKIFEKIKDIMTPQFEDENPLNPFDFWEGADFKIKARRVDGWVTYDKSEFNKSSEFMSGDDTKLEEIYNQLYSLSDLIAPEQFKSYEELERKFNQVMNINVNNPAPVKEEAKNPYDDASNNDGDDSSTEDALSYFKSLATVEDE